MFKQDTKKDSGQIYDCIDKDNFLLVQWLQVWVSVSYRLLHLAYDVLIINFMYMNI